MDDSLYIEKYYDLSSFKSYAYKDMYVLNEDLLFATREDQDCKHVFLHLKEKQQQEIDFSLPFVDCPSAFYIAQTISAKHPALPYFVSFVSSYRLLSLINAVLTRFSGEMSGTMLFRFLEARTGLIV